MYLDRDFQNFWDVRRCGKSYGLRIKCPACNAEPPSQRDNEDFIMYGYRKWRWLANHMVSAHMADRAERFRRRHAEEGSKEIRDAHEQRLKVVGIRKSKSAAA